MGIYPFKWPIVWQTLLSRWGIENYCKEKGGQGSDGFPVTLLLCEFKAVGI